MSEGINPSISKVSKTFNNLPIDSTIQGMKIAALLEREIVEAERQQIENKAKIEIKETQIPTGAEIRQAREEGEYR